MALGLSGDSVSKNGETQERYIIVIQPVVCYNFNVVDSDKPRFMEMYEKAINGKISCMITHGEANDPEFNSLLKENQKEYIYHSELVRFA